MKLFLKNTTLFLLFSLTLFVLSFVILDYANNRQLNRFSVSATTESIAVGDSHVELAINDQMLPRTINLSQRGDPFKYSLLKVKMALQKQSSIKKIYLGVSYHNLSSYYDGYISGKYAAGIDSKYIFILPIDDKLAILKENISDLFILLRLSFTNGFSSLNSDQRRFTFLGRYDNSYKKTKATRQAIDRRILEQFYENGVPRGFSSKNYTYLNQIIGLCKRQRVELVFLNTPLHPYYRSRVPQKFVDRYNSLARQNNIAVVDFRDLSLPDSCFTPDGDHVSEKGAFLTTRNFLASESRNREELVQR